MNIEYAPFVLRNEVSFDYSHDDRMTFIYFSYCHVWGIEPNPSQGFPDLADCSTNWLRMVEEQYLLFCDTDTKRPVYPIALPNKVFWVAYTSYDCDTLAFISAEAEVVGVTNRWDMVEWFILAPDIFTAARFVQDDQLVLHNGKQYTLISDNPCDGAIYIQDLPIG